MRDASSVIRYGSLLGCFAVIFGAFGSHWLSKNFPVERMNVWEIGVRYQMYHALALLLCGVICQQESNNAKNVRRSLRGTGSSVLIASNFFVWGSVVFSGSLYLLVITNTAWLGAVTPIGGILLVVGWIFLFFGTIGWNKTETSDTG